MLFIKSVECGQPHHTGEMIMGFRTMFLEWIGRPALAQMREEAERLRQRRMGDVLLVMARYYQEHPKNASMTFWVIAQKLRQEGLVIDLIALIQTLDNLMAQGLIQKLDGGNKERRATDVDYIISDNGLNHVGRFDD